MMTTIICAIYLHVGQLRLLGLDLVLSYRRRTFTFMQILLVWRDLVQEGGGICIR